MAIVVEDEPDDGIVHFDGDRGSPVFGFYEGTPHGERGHGYGLTLPDKITIYRGPHERCCETVAELHAEVRMTLIHELAHHMGFDEQRVDELGWA
ncbi:MAG: metallopeptidase family protein [Thermomicrobiales bacterium]